jgi:hypothetical protein
MSIIADVLVWSQYTDYRHILTDIADRDTLSASLQFAVSQNFVEKML